jgi:hypothetical protein
MGRKMLQLPVLKSSDRRNVKINGTGTAFTSSPATGAALQSIRGDRLNDPLTVASLLFLSKGRSPQTLQINAENIAINSIRTLPRIASKRCEEKSRRAPFRGGRQDTLYRVTYSWVQNGQFLIGQRAVPGPLRGVQLEFFGEGNRFTGIDTANGFVLLIGQGLGEVTEPRIISVRRWDGMPDTGGDIVIQPDYWCNIRKTPIKLADGRGLFFNGDDIFLGLRPTDTPWQIDIFAA